MPFDIYIAGVGGQGLGLLSQALLRAVDHSGQPVLGVDTHGLAQRGGAVVSRVRCGGNAYSPLTLRHGCDLVLGMEIHEALRGLDTAMAKGGTLVYLNQSWQPLPVRLGNCGETAAEDVEAACKQMDVRSIGMTIDAITDPRMQNMALLGFVAGMQLIPGVPVQAYKTALADLLTDPLLTRNLALFDRYV